MIYLALVICILAACSLLHARRIAPWRLYATAAGLVLLASLASVALMPFAPELVWSFEYAGPGVTFYQPSGRGYVHDTFIAPLLSVLLALLPAFFTCLVLWVQDRSGAMIFPSLTRWLFWPIIAGMVLIPGVVTLFLVNGDIGGGPTRLLLGLSRIAQLAGVATMIAIAALTAWSFLRHLRLRR
ncbi:hypothetical protein [Roseovarius atlanticus]|uniref:hypothetical protein n=1 Tax=Roseovarius atlanticus TaxID=1641875 RepID=UPI001C96B41D|nr:hypothetical protein [Roseovarius atlanticus]MBY5989360.1 hypothetical protein [Roseovarius atlanticus]MBY6124752.1 hypothetical protein [Roseovarius atlanticus]MBY6149247.1 hypothetical protein [Roseovarius atlanticus]